MTETTWLGFSIDRTSKIPVFEQICLAIRTRANSGELAEGAKLPPTREFATELGVSRSTIVTAYEQLVAEGYLRSRARSGYHIWTSGNVELASHIAPPATIAEADKPHSPIPFEAGQPDMRLFPYRQWAKTLARSCRTNPQAMFEESPVFGNFNLRKAVANHVSEWRGIQASPRQIIITAGATDAVELCLRTLLNRGDKIGLEDPGYPRVRQFAKVQDLTLTYLDIDEHGTRIPDELINPRLVFVTPSHQYPLGGAMSPNRRLEFIQWANKQKAWILEDDFDSEFRYAGRPIPALAGFDQLNHTLYAGSFAKLFSRSLRLGYLIIPENLLDRFHASFRSFGARASLLPQQALADFMTSGEFYRHLRRMRRIYAERRAFLLAQLRKDFSDIGSFIDHQAGTLIVLHLNDRYHDSNISRQMQQRGFRLQTLSSFSSDRSNHNGLILGFCAYTREEMKPALTALRSCFS